MSRIHQIAPEKATGKVKDFYAAIQKKLGRVPNIFLNLGNSPSVLEGFLNFSGAADQTSLSPQLREQIALAVAQTNQCNYCLSAHTVIGKGAGLKDEDIIHARKIESKDPKTQAILNFAKKVVELRGKVSDANIAALKVAGVNDTELVEIMLVIFVNMFTNYFNHVTDPKIDFPEACALNK